MELKVENGNKFKDRFVNSTNDDLLKDSQVRVMLPP